MPDLAGPPAADPRPWQVVPVDPAGGVQRYFVQRGDDENDIVTYGMEDFASRESAQRICDALNGLAGAAVPARRAGLIEELRAAYEGWRRTLMNEPQENGQYAHLLICSGSRHHPPGTPGVSCCCRIAPRDLAGAPAGATLLTNCAHCGASLSHAYQCPACGVAVTMGTPAVSLGAPAAARDGPA